jgi:HopA1 effector protein family
VSAYRDQVAQVLRVVAVSSATTYTWFGCRSDGLPRALAAAMSPAVAREYLVSQLGDELYRSFYTHGRPVPRSADAARPYRADQAFVARLSKVNSGTGGWDDGWSVQLTADGILQLQGKDLRVRARAEDCRPRSGAPSVGDPVSLRRPKELRAASPGFYTALSDEPLVIGPEAAELRVYFNVTPTGAEPLVAVSTRLLNEAKIPFQLKVVDHPIGFSRCDTAVLYLDGDGFQAAREALIVVASSCAAHLRADVPPFTKPLGPGVAVAEHRVGPGSFGSSRCRLLAAGILAAHERGLTGLDDRLEVMADEFASSGVDLDAPYLAAPPVSRHAL